MIYRYEITDSASFSHFDGNEFKNSVSRHWMTDEDGFKYPCDEGVDFEDRTPPDYIHDYKVTILVETNAEELTVNTMRGIIALAHDSLLTRQYMDGIPHKGR